MSKWIVIVDAQSQAKCYGTFDDYEASTAWLRAHQFAVDEAQIYPVTTPAVAAEAPPATSRIMLQAVTSSNVEALGRDGADAIVKFRSGATYRYAGAGDRVQQGLVAPSVGQWVNGELVNRGGYRVTKLTPEETSTLSVGYPPADSPS